VSSPPGHARRQTNGSAPHLAHPVMRHQPPAYKSRPRRRRQPLRSPRRTDPQTAGDTPLPI
jgi:hypothetical protein